MIASDIINLILQRYKMLCAKYPQSPSFIPNTKGDSFYLISNRGEGLQPTQIRLSNHGTYLETWCDRNELGDSVERLNPALCVNISIVFVDEGEDLTKDCKGMANCEGCEIEPCKPQTFEGQDQIGRPFTVIQYVYSSKCIRRKHINGLTKAIAEASTKGKYIDPLADLYRAAKDKEFHSLTKLQNSKGLKPENKQYKRNTNMNKKLIRLTESDLHRIVTESVNKILTETIRYKFPRFLYHKSPVSCRQSIMKKGLIPSVGDSYKAHWDDNYDLKPYIFLYDHNSIAGGEYDSTYDDDIYAIDVSKLDREHIFRDPDKSMRGCFVYDIPIPPSVIKMVYKGSEKDSGDLSIHSHVYD